MPGYTDALQTHIEANTSAKRALSGVSGEATGGAITNCTDASPVLQQLRGGARPSPGSPTG